MRPDIVASQKRTDTIAAFWPRRISPYVTSVLLPTRITANQTTVLWGTISTLNSWLVYVAMTGGYAVIPLIPLVYAFTYTLDCVDGEIARFRKLANPVGGKLLDGICHRATEYSLLGAFVLAAYERTGSWLVLPVAVLLFSADAMYSYVYERRLTALRVHAGFVGHVKRSEQGVYERGTAWSALTRAQKIRTFTGQLQYKSIYPMVALSYVSPHVLLAALAGLALYKHWKWIGLVGSTLAAVVGVSAADQADSGAVGHPVSAAGAGH